MKIEFVRVGFGSMVAVHRIMAMASTSHPSAPIRKNIQVAREAGKVINLTMGRKTRSVIYMDTGQIALSLFEPKILVNRTGRKLGTGPGGGER